MASSAVKMEQCFAFVNVGGIGLSATQDIEAEIKESAS
jgi:hypothetical protein